MSSPSDLEVKAASTLARLQNHARDLEADLGKISRNVTNNPNLGSVSPLVHAGGEPWDISQQNADLTHHRIVDYSTTAGAALGPFNGQASTPSERAAIAEIAALVTSIQSVSTLDDATALVASF
jgi:hypothetical protein